MGTTSWQEKQPVLEEEIDAICAAICSADRALLEAESSRDLELATGYMAPDIVLQPPGQAPVNGLEAVREFYASWFSIPYRAIHVRAQSVSLYSLADLAYLVGESPIETSGPQEGLHVPGKYLGIWRKIDGE